MKAIKKNDTERMEELEKDINQEQAEIEKELEIELDKARKHVAHSKALRAWDEKHKKK